LAVFSISWSWVSVTTKTVEAASKDEAALIAESYMEGSDVNGETNIVKIISEGTYMSDTFQLDEEIYEVPRLKLLQGGKSD